MMDVKTSSKSLNPFLTVSGNQKQVIRGQIPELLRGCDQAIGLNELYEKGN